MALLMGGSGIGDLASVINTGSAFDQAIAGGSIGGPIGYQRLTPLWS